MSFFRKFRSKPTDPATGGEAAAEDAAPAAPNGAGDDAAQEPDATEELDTGQDPDSGQDPDPPRYLAGFFDEPEALDAADAPGGAEDAEGADQQATAAVDAADTGTFDSADDDVDIVDSDADVADTAADPVDQATADDDEATANDEDAPVGAAEPAAPTRRAARTARGRRRRRALVAATGIVALVGAGGVAAAAAHKTVELDVDGQTREVSTFTGDIEGLLANEGIELAEHDLVVPGPEEALQDGSQVVVRSARQVAFQVDGQYETLWTTSMSADEALAQLNASGRTAALTASRSADGRAELPMPITQGEPVKVIVDDTERMVEPPGPVDLEGVLRLAEVELKPADRVGLSLDENGAAVLTVTRVEAAETTRTETIEHDSVERETSDLFRGQSRVVQEGADGERTYTMAQILVDGEVESTKHVSVEVTTEPEDRIVEVGTAERPAPRPEPSTSSGSSGSSSGGSGSSSSGSDSGGSDSGGSDGGSDSGGGSAPEGVWAQLAQCESGGNPSIVSSNGLYHGLYQFRVDTWRSVGGSGLPSEASPAEQTKRAQILQQRSGWGQWPACARQLGLL